MARLWTIWVETMCEIGEYKTRLGNMGKMGAMRKMADKMGRLWEVAKLGEMVHEMYVIRNEQSGGWDVRCILGDMVGKVDEMET